MVPLAVTQDTAAAAAVEEEVDPIVAVVVLRAQQDLQDADQVVILVRVVVDPVQVVVDLVVALHADHHVVPTTEET